MLYVFDTSSLREASHMSPTVFRTFWDQFNDHVAKGVVVSVKEALHELKRQSTKEHLDSSCCTASHSIENGLGS